MSRSDFIRSFGKKFSVANAIESAKQKRRNELYDRQFKKRYQQQDHRRTLARVQAGKPSLRTSSFMVKRSRTYRRTGASKRRAAGKSPGRRQAFRRRAPGSLGRRGSLRARVGRRLRRRYGGGRLGVAYPPWFKQILKTTANTCQLVDNRAYRLVADQINKKFAWTMFHGLQTRDLDSTIQTGLSSTASTGTNAAKIYMYNHGVDHIWKNNTNTPAVMEFYILVPRRDMPVWDSANAAPTTGSQSNQISPPNTLNYADCVRAAPSMYTRAFVDMDQGFGSSIKVAADDIEATPYMAYPVASFFKVKPLRVMGPNGRSAFQTLAPGTEATLSVKHTKPRLVNFNKYGLTGVTSANIAATYEVLRETPLIFVYLRGGIGHEKSTATPPVPLTSVASTFAAVDYMRKSHWRRVIVATGVQQTVQLVPPVTFVNAAKESNQFFTDDVEEDLV